MRESTEFGFRSRSPFRISFAIGLVSFAMFGTWARADPDEEASYRVVSKELTEGSTYGVFPAVIHSKQEFAQYMKESVEVHLEDDQQTVREMITKIAERAQVDFAQEALVLLPYQEFEFAKVQLEKPKMNKKGLLISGVRRSNAAKAELDQEITNQFWFALAVDRAKVRTIEWQIDGRKDATFRVAENNRQRKQDRANAQRQGKKTEALLKKYLEQIRTLTPALQKAAADEGDLAAAEAAATLIEKSIGPKFQALLVEAKELADNQIVEPVAVPSHSRLAQLAIETRDTIEQIQASLVKIRRKPKVQAIIGPVIRRFKLDVLAVDAPPNDASPKPDQERFEDLDD